VVFGYFFVLFWAFCFALSFPGVFAGQMGDGENITTVGKIQLPWKKTDVMVWYLFLFGLGFFGVANQSPKFRHVLRTPVPRLQEMGWRTSYGELFLIFTFILEHFLVYLVF
jgi:hypothetical protein